MLDVLYYKGKAVTYVVRTCNPSPFFVFIVCTKAIKMFELTEFSTVSFRPRVGVSRSASETDD